jgi:coenzyme F420-reducing hydrogenase alpha subunit
MLGQVVQNQASSMFLFTLPDRLGLASIFELADREDASTEEANIARRALEIRQVGTHLISLAGGQFIHPVKAVVGGVISGVSASAARAMRTEIERTIPIACQLVDTYWALSEAMGDRLGTWGDHTPAYYIAAVADERPDYTGDRIRVLAPNGHLDDVFEAAEFRQHLQYRETDYSYAGQTSYEGNPMRANSLARANLAEEMGTPLADTYLRRFRETFGHPAHAIMLFDLARGIELVYALERAVEILDAGGLDEEDTDVSYTPCDGEGFGLVEAPRGPLIHHYIIQDGRVATAEFIIPTVHNSLAIEHALRYAAERHISGANVDLPALEEAVGRVVRAFDPCIACATH